MADLQPVRLDELLNGVTPYCRSCPPGPALVALRRAMRTFCERTELWQEELDPIDLVADQADYTLAYKWLASIVRVLEVRLLSTEEVSAGSEGHIVALQFYEFTPPETLTLNDQIKPQAAVTDGMVVKVVLVPKWRVPEVPEWFIDQWAEPLCARAVWDLKGQASEAWYDPNGRQEWADIWNDGLNRAMGNVARGFGVGGGLHA